MKKYLIEYPELMKEWDIDMNANIDASKLTCGSEKLICWKCEKGHTWQENVYKRVVRKYACPYCSGKRASKDYNFAIMYPNLLLEWSHIKNNGIDPNALTPFSAKKVWWKCHNGEDHEWMTSIKKRTLYKQNCPYCSHNKASKSNNLTIQFPERAKYWHPTKNNDKTPHNILPKSNLTAWWQCVVNPNHEWQTVISSYVNSNYYCPFCENCSHVITEKNSLCSKPKLIAQWHLVKNKDINPNSVLAYSNKKYWWLCEKGHEWQTSPNNRKYTECPVCRQSKGELEIQIYLKNNNYVFKQQYKDTNCKNKRVLAFDFAVWVNDKLHLIEFQGEQHYENNKFFWKPNESKVKLNLIRLRDNLKREYCRTHQIPLLEIHYKHRGNIDQLLKEFLSQENTQAITISAN